ncbi:hypothetical protein HDU97_000227 [Phlyctochytrium planicorne]|nr:hypothetical protein HDU97_000227 [Phlyctochytrium planicorne]
MTTLWRDKVHGYMQSITGLQAQAKALESEIHSLLQDPHVSKHFHPNTTKKQPSKPNKHDRRREKNLERIRANADAALLELDQHPQMRLACAMMSTQGHEDMKPKVLEMLDSGSLGIKELKHVFLKPVPPLPMTREEVGAAISLKKNQGYRILLAREPSEPLCIAVRPNMKVNHLKRLVTTGFESSRRSATKSSRFKFKDIGPKRIRSWRIFWRRHTLAVTNVNWDPEASDIKDSAFKAAMKVAKIKKVFRNGRRKLQSYGVEKGSVIKLVTMRTDRKEERLKKRAREQDYLQHVRKKGRIQ